MSHYDKALPAQSAAGATSLTYVGTVETTDDKGDTLVAITLTPPAGYTTVTGVATNNVTFNVLQYRAGASLGTVATVTLASGTNLVALTPLNVPVTAPLAIKRGDVFVMQMVQNASGLAVGAGVFAQVEIK